MSKFQEVTLRIPAASDYVAVARLAISGVAARMNYTIEEIDDIKVAVSEACTNVVQHAYDHPETSHINVACKIYENKLEITVSDEGKGYDPERVVSEKINTQSIEKFGLGLGMTFIKSLMDDAEFTSSPGEGSAVRMTKLLKHVS